MAFAEETTISTPSGGVQIGELRVADYVLAAGLDLDWNQYALKLAESTAGPVTMVRLELANGVSITATADQLFVGADRRLYRCDGLGPGSELLTAGRQRIDVLRVTHSHYDGALCAIGTTSSSPLDGHLLEANGVIVADYYVEESGS